MTSIWIELAKVVVDLVRAVAWPTAIVVLALKFKPELLAALPPFFRRQVEVEALGFRAMIGAAEQQQISPEAPALESLSEPTPLEPSLRLAINLVEAPLLESLKAIEPSKREATLLRALAGTRLERAHEFIYNRIFGSQIAYVRRLNEISKTTVAHSREFFEPYAVKFPFISQTRLMLGFNS